VAWVFCVCGKCVTWCLHMCDKTPSNVWHDVSCVLHGPWHARNTCKITPLHGSIACGGMIITCLCFGFMVIQRLALECVGCVEGAWFLICVYVWESERLWTVDQDSCRVYKNMHTCARNTYTNNSTHTDTHTHTHTHTQIRKHMHSCMRIFVVLMHNTDPIQFWLACDKSGKIRPSDSVCVKDF